MNLTQRIVVLSPDIARFRQVCEVMQLDPGQVYRASNADELAEYACQDYHLVIDRVELPPAGIAKEDIDPGLVEYMAGTRLSRVHRRKRLMERTTWVELDRHEEKGASYRCHLRGPEQER